MTKLTIRGRVMASFAVVLAVIVIMAGITFTRVLNIEGQAKFIAADAVPRIPPRGRHSGSRPGPRPVQASGSD